MSARRRGPGGFTLPEVVIAVTMLLFTMGTAVVFFRSQTRAFDRGSEQVDLLQQARFAIGHAERLLGATGAGTVPEQPMLVFGSDSIVAFNADWVDTARTGFRWAAAFNPSVPAAAVTAWDATATGTIAGTTVVYPPRTFLAGSGAPSPAETYTLRFEPDTTTARGDDLILVQRVNAGAPEIIARNLLPYPGRPFLQYLIARRVSSGGAPAADTLLTAGSAELPLVRRLLAPGMTAADTARAVRPDSVRAIRLSLAVTNGLSGADERRLLASTVVLLPNNGDPVPVPCGAAPAAPGYLAVGVDTAGSGRFNLTWPASADQGGGEGDVRSYSVLARRDTAATWDGPILTVRRDTTATYRVQVGGFVPGRAYRLGVVATDCTPAGSAVTSATGVAP